MHWKTTLALLVLVAAAAAWLWKGDEWAVAWHLREPAPSVEGSATLAALEQHVAPGKLTRVELPSPDPGTPFAFEPAADEAGWKLPGNWPLRKPEVGKLVGLLANLRTRFQPVPAPPGTDLAPFGLAAAQSPFVVKVTADGKPFTLAFGEPPAGPGDGAFSRPAYLRVNDFPEVLRLGPDVLPVLRRPLDAYRKRQLFPDADRVKLAGKPADPFGGGPAVNAAVTPVLGDKVEAVAVTGPGSTLTVFGLKVPVADGTFTLTRTAPTPKPTAPAKGGDEAVTPTALAGSWELTAPARDRVDPDKLRAVLAAVPDLWADDFARNLDQFFAFADLVTPVNSPAGLATGAALAERAGKAEWFLKRTGLDKPERTVAVRRPDGATVTLEIGSVAAVKERQEAAPPPPRQPGMPPLPPATRTVREEYRYARLKDNPAAFVVKADKFADLFARVNDLKDAKLARFDAADVLELTVAAKGKPPVTLVKKKGNKDAADEADRRDRWSVARDPNPVPADEAKVDELVNALAGLEARGPQAVTVADAKAAYDIDPAGGTKVWLKVRDKRPDDQPPAPERTVTFLVGRADAAGKKLPVKVEGWPRVNLVDDSDDKVSKLLDRPAVAYRGKRLFDTAAADLTAVTVKAAGGESFALARDANGANWKLTQPLASDTDAGKVSQLTGDLARLEAVEFVADAPKPEELAKYGLDKPAFTATLAFAGKSHALDIGTAAEGKPETYARLDGGSVFTVAKSLPDALKAGAVALLPTQLWSVPVEKFTAVGVRRVNGKEIEDYTLTPEGTDWALAGDFRAKVPFLSAQPLLTALSNVKAERYEALAVADPAAFGLDAPPLTVTVSYKEPTPGAAGETVVTRKLVVGKPTADGSARFARLEGGPNPAVFALAPGLVAGVDKPALDLLDKTLLFLDPASITQLKVTGPKPGDAVTLVKDDKGGWKAEGQAFAVDAPTAARLAEAFARFPVRRIAAYGPRVKWADYGLDTVEFTVTGTANGTPHTVALGKPDGAGDRYARVDNGPALAVVAGRAAADLARGRLEYVDRSLLTFDPQSLTGLARKKGADELEVEPGATQGWNVTKPAKQKADQPLMEELAEQLGRLRAVRVAAFGPKDVLKEYGLDAPAAVVTLKVGDKPDLKVLRLGKPVDEKAPDGERFATVEGPSADVTVGVLPAALCKRLLADPIGFRDRGLAKFVDADKLTLERGDRTVTFSKVDGTWKVTAPLAADAEQADLDEFVNALAKLRADELVADKPADLKPFGLDKPEAKWTAFDKGAVVLTLAVGKTDADGRAYAKVEKADTVAKLDPALTGRVLGEYRKRKVWDGVDAAQADTLVVSAADRTFVLRKTGMTWADPAKPGEPIDPKAVAEVLDTLAGLKAARYAADANADPKLYGLEKPERVIVVSQRGGVSKTLQIGREEGGSGGKRVYARVLEPGRSDVFVLGEADTAALMRDRGAFGGKK